MDVLLAVVFQSLPDFDGGAAQGPAVGIAAFYDATNAEVQPSLGRKLSGRAKDVEVNLVEPGSEFLERRNQLDLRLAKILRLAGSRATLSVDLYNALNSSRVNGVNDTFDSWFKPEDIMMARFIRFSGQIDF